MLALGNLINAVVQIYIFVLIVNIALTWLIHFGIVNARQKFVQIVGDVTSRLTDPLLRPIRRYVPMIGGLDLSPVILILLLYLIRDLLFEYVIFA
ncbi:MAG: YggT family protein [Rhodospirillaceae bacterium]|nr:YggT family protein [Rhodospirillaceae bacterium]